MSRPLTAKRETQNKANAWHAKVFARYGPWCYLHRRGKALALDAAHIIARARLGTALAYVDERLGRPLCRSCHELQGVGKIAFPLRDRREAVAVHNSYAKAPLPMPTK